MWPMIAGPGLRCGECRHNILPGRLCLSELPEEMQPGVSRSDFRNYCIGCPECWRRGMHACYVRYLEGGNSQGRTDRSLPCSRCGRRIPSGDRAGIETHYDWPSALDDRYGLTGRATARTSTAGTVGMAAGLEVLVRGMPSGSFADLSAQTGKGAASDEDEGAVDNEESNDAGGSGAKLKLKMWSRRKGRNLGLEGPGGRPAPLIDQVHRLMHLWRAGDQSKVDDYLDTRGLQRNALFSQILQALIELADADSDERSILEAISNHAAGRGDVRAPRQQRLLLGDTP